MKRQDVLFRLESGYAGHPYHVTGNAILHAMAHSGTINEREQRLLRASHGVFCPSVYGVFPSWHSQSGGRMNFGSTLKPVEAYEDLFLFRRADHQWILDKRPRDAFNTFTVNRFSEDYYYMPQQYVKTRSDQKPAHSNWFLHAYLMAPNDSDVLPLADEAFENLQFGRYRNYGFGAVSLKETSTVDLDGIDISRIEDADDFVIELVTPYVLESEYPETDSNPVPWWWDRDLSYRHRKERIVHQREFYDLETVDHGQVTAYTADRAVDTALKGVERIGTHSKYGFGEFMIRPTA